MTKVQPMYDPKLRESYLNRRNSTRLVLEIVDDRNSKIGGSKVIEHVQHQSHQAYDQVTTNVWSKFLTIVLKSQVVDDRNSKIGRGKIFEHVQNLSYAILTRK